MNSARKRWNSLGLVGEWMIFEPQEEVFAEVLLYPDPSFSGRRSKVPQVGLVQPGSQRQVWVLGEQIPLREQSRSVVQ